MSRSRKFHVTVLSRNWSSPDSYSAFRNVLIEHPADQIRGLIETYCALHGHSDRFAGPNEPQRAWWPDSPPQVLKSKFAKMAKVLLADDQAKYIEILETLARGEWFWFTSVPEVLQNALRALAVEDETSEPIPGEPFKSGLEEHWDGFFRFLARLGIKAVGLPARTSAHEASVEPGEFQAVIDLIQSDVIERISVDYTPWPEKK